MNPLRLIFGTKFDRDSEAIKAECGKNQCPRIKNGFTF